MGPAAPRFRNSTGPQGRCRTSLQSQFAIRNFAPTEPIMFSPLDPHTMYYATNYLFKTTDGGQNWQTISPDLTRTDPGVPPSVGNFISKNPDAAKQRGVIYSLAPSFKNINTIWAGTDDGQLWSTRDGGKNWS